MERTVRVGQEGTMHKETGVRSAPGGQMRQEAQAKEGLGSGLPAIGCLQHH